MQAIVLAAGLGRRLRPLTRTIPKPALPIVGQPMVRQILRRLGALSYGEVAVNLHHLGPRLAEALADFETLGLSRLHLSPEEELLGTGGGIRRCAAFLPDSGPSILVHNGDCLHDIDLRSAADVHRRSGLDATWILAPWRPGYTRVRADGDRVRAIGDPDGELLFTGCHFLSRERIKTLPVDAPSDVMRDLYRETIDAGRVGAAIHDGFWWEFGTCESYLAGCLELIGMPAEARDAIAATDPVEAIGACRVAVGEGAQRDATSLLEGAVALGAGVRVGEGARVGDSVVLSGATIGSHAVLSRTVIGPGVAVPDGARWTDAAVAVLEDGELAVEPMETSP